VAKRKHAGTAQRSKVVLRPEQLPPTVSKTSFGITYSTAWFSEPFSVEKFISNPGYREFMLGPLGPFEPRHLAQCLQRTRPGYESVVVMRWPRRACSVRDGPLRLMLGAMF
jgi:hypothetical protein